MGRATARFGLAVVVTWLALGFGTAAAADHPVEGDFLRLRDPVNPTARNLRFRAIADPAIDVTTVPDPRVGGAILEVAGTGPGDGTSGMISLAAGFWKGLGRPAGAGGYRYFDSTQSTGVRRVDIVRGRNGLVGGILLIARGPNWPFLVQQPQEQVELRLTFGTETYCAEFGSSSLRRNLPPLVIGRLAPPPVDCAFPVCGNGDTETPEECDDGGTTPGDGCDEFCDIEPFCGDGEVQGTEECDDGGALSGDGCSSTCELEDVSAICAGVPAVSGTAMVAELVSSGLDSPTHLTAPRLDPNRLFVVEQGGTIRIIENGVLVAQPFLDITSKIQCLPGCGERGLLSLAFHPNYESNGRFFVNYTNTAGDTVIARYQVSVDPDVADDTSELILTTIGQPFANHNGGQIAFGPDGYLYVGMGDGGSGGDPLESGQTDTTLLGKMLRFDVAVETAPYYAVPPSNPNSGAGDPLGLIWAKGFRNPWRFSFDRANGDVYIGDVGQEQREEIDYQPAASSGGENYGWNVFEGKRCYDPGPHFASCAAASPSLTPPVHEYTHDSGACSITGGFVYRGCAMPDLAGTYFYADFCNNKISSLKVVGGAAQNLVNRTADLDPPGPLTVNSITSFGEDARGEIYILDRGGEVFKIIPQ